MREVRLIAVSDDGTHLILSGDDDERLAVQIDESLHAAIRGDRARLGQLEIQVENQLRPRDIQARIRSGESVEGVAAVAGMPEEKVRRFAGPVLAEREHIAGRARQATIRRVHTDGPPRVLEEAAVQAATRSGATAESVEWDAWRRDDSRWQVRCSWHSPGSETSGSGTETIAHFTFDPSGRSVLADDDAARFVAGDVEPEPEYPVTGPDLVGNVDDSTDDALDTGIPDAPPRLSVVPAAPEDGPDVEEELQSTLPEGVVGLDSNTAPADDRNPRRPRRGGRENRRRDAGLWAAGSTEASRSSTSTSTETSGTDEPAPQEATTEEPAADATAMAPGEDEAALAEPATSDTDHDETPTDRLHLSDIADRVEEVPDKPAAPKQGKQGKSGSRSRRPSVPTWDEIMFGRSKSSE